MPLFMFKHDNSGFLHLSANLLRDDTITATAVEPDDDGEVSIASVTLHYDQLCKIADHLQLLLDGPHADETITDDRPSRAHRLAVDSIMEKDFPDIDHTPTTDPAAHFLHLFTFLVDNPTITQLSTASMYASSGQLAGNGRQTKHGPTLPLVNCASHFDKPKYKLVDQHGLLVKAPKKFRSVEDTV